MGSRTLFVDSGNAARKDYAIEDKYGDRVHIISDGLEMPSGIAFRKNGYYVVANNRLLRFSNIESNLIANPPMEVISEALPTKKYHGWRYIKFGP